MLHHNVDYTPYEGLEITGWPELVLSRGEIIAQNGDCTGAPGRGLFLPRAAPELAKPRKRAQ
jgi:dihydropyrimidinase